MPSVASANWARAGRDVIVKCGLNEKQTADLFSELLTTEKSAELAKSAQRYFDALQSFCSVSYQPVAADYPSHVPTDNLTVPLWCSSAGQPDSPISDTLRSYFTTFNKRILVEGGPGSGKTTLLREIARCAWSKPEAVGLDGRYIPLPIRLRNFGQVTGAVLEERLLRALDAGRQIMIKGAPPPKGYFEGWPNALEAPWLFLLDGFDEIAPDHRYYVLNFLDQLVGDEYALILTTRPTEIRPELRQSFANVRLLPFSDEQQQMLVQKLVGPSAADFLAEFNAYANGELGGTPLLITIAATVYNRSGELPLRRSELYGRFISDAWQEAQTRGAKDELSADLFELSFLCLQRIARKMTEGSGGGSALDFGSGEAFLTNAVAQFLAEELGLSKTVSEIKAKQVLAALTSYSGILQSEPNQFEWLHPTFREYLAANDFAGAPEDVISTLLRHCGDVSWRQVVLFFVSIQSIRGDVEAILREVLSVDPPSGVEVAAVAVIEGANVEQRFAKEVAQAICDAIIQLSKGGFCERLLSTDSNKVERLISALDILGGNLDLKSELAGLYQELVRSAIAYGAHDACGVQDLQALKAPYQTLMQIARDGKASTAVRARAATSLIEAGRVEEGCATINEIASLAKLGATRWADAVRVLVIKSDPEVFSLLASGGQISFAQWNELLDSPGDDNKGALFERLSRDPRLSKPQRLAVKIRMASDRQELIDLLLTAPDQLIARGCVDALVKQCDEAALTTVLEASTEATYASLAALEGLASLKAHRVLRALVSSPTRSYSLRRRAAEFLYGAVSDRGIATELLAFFSHQRAVQRQAILSKKAFLAYYLDDYEQALALFDHLFKLGRKSAWAYSVYGHCLQRLGRLGDARKAYNKSLRLSSVNEFARSQRVYLSWLEHDIDKAFEDILRIPPYTDQHWIAPVAVEVLRLAEDYDRADEWLGYINREDGKQRRLGMMLRSHLSFCRGLIGEALEDYQHLSGLDEPEVYDEIYVAAWEKLAGLLRACGRPHAAIIEYDKMLAVWGDGRDSSRKAESLLALGAVSDADGVIAQLRISSPEDPFPVYLEGLSRGMKGDCLAMEKSAVRALEMADGTLGTDWLANRAIYCHAGGKVDQAKSTVLDLVKGRELDQIRLYAIPYLESLARAVPDRSGVHTSIAELSKLAWPNGWVLDAAKGRRERELRNLRRGTYPFPMYCQQWRIEGLEADKDLGDRILQNSANGKRSIALWTMGQSDRVYGQCNFAKDTNAQNDLKFCDDTKTVVQNNLRFFANNLDVQQLLFLEEDLRDRFDQAARDARLSVQCKMVDL